MSTPLTMTYDTAGHSDDNFEAFTDEISVAVSEFHPALGLEPLEWAMLHPGNRLRAYEDRNSIGGFIRRLINPEAADAVTFKYDADTYLGSITWDPPAGGDSQGGRLVALAGFDRTDLRRRFAGTAEGASPGTELALAGTSDEDARVLALAAASELHGRDRRGQYGPLREYQLVDLLHATKPLLDTAGSKRQAVEALVPDAHGYVDDLLVAIHAAYLPTGA